MTEDSPLDPTTGLLHRTAFLKAVREAQTNLPASIRRGCLLIVYFPGLQQIAKRQGTPVAAQQLKNLLATMETRLRSRDTLGRIAEHSLCVLLRQCREKDALAVADQYATLISSSVFDAKMQRAIEGMYYRIVPLDARGKRSRQSVSREAQSAGFTATSNLLSAIDNLPESPAVQKASVVSLQLASSGGALNKVAESVDELLQRRSSAVNNTQGRAQPTFGAWRLKPGVTVRHEPLVCCHRLQSVGIKTQMGPLSDCQWFKAALAALSVDERASASRLDSQLVIDVEPAQLSAESALWLREQCRDLRVAPSDVCLAMDMASLSGGLRDVLPTLRELSRFGIKLMVQGLASAQPFLALHNLVPFDFVMLSAKILQGSVRDQQLHQQLIGLIAEVHGRRREVCASGVDTAALFSHALELKIDIGFGRACGKSTPFPVADSLGS